MSDVPGVSPSTLKADLKDRLTAPIRYYRPLMLTGIPGVGKTAVVGQVCQALGIPFWTARPITAADGWCEDPSDRRYNRPIRMSAGQPGDRLRRADALYDLIIEIDHNQRPRIAGRGSAVFIHVARADMTPTAGCVSMPAATLRGLLSRLGPNTTITIHG